MLERHFFGNCHSETARRNGRPIHAELVSAAAFQGEEVHEFARDGDLKVYTSRVDSLRSGFLALNGSLRTEAKLRTAIAAVGTKVLIIRSHGSVQLCKLAIATYAEFGDRD